MSSQVKVSCGEAIGKWKIEFSVSGKVQENEEQQQAKPQNVLIENLPWFAFVSSIVSF